MNGTTAHGSSREIACLIALHSIPGMTHRALRRLIGRFGSAERAVHEVTEADVRGLPGLNPEVRRTLLACRRRLHRARQIAERFERLGGRVVWQGTRMYPGALEALSNPPRLLYVLGCGRILASGGVGIVGSSTPSAKGRALAAEIARRLSRAGYVVISGMAKGVDLAAHRGAMEAGGRTVFVLPQGLLQFRPPGDLGPWDDILARSAAVSEVPPDASWSPQAAVARNRLIAALSAVVVLVETRSHGGALHTVRAAEILNRPVFAVQYAEPPPSASGNNVAITRGATPLTCLADLRAVLDALPQPTLDADSGA